MPPMMRAMPVLLKLMQMRCGISLRVMLPETSSARSVLQKSPGLRGYRFYLPNQLLLDRNKTFSDTVRPDAHTADLGPALQAATIRLGDQCGSGFRRSGHRRRSHRYVLAGSQRRADRGAVCQFYRGGTKEPLAGVFRQSRPQCEKR